jgi:hypothetical protein
VPARTDQTIRDIGLDRRKRQRILFLVEQPERSRALTESAEQTTAGGKSDTVSAQTEDALKFHHNDTNTPFVVIASPANVASDEIS